MKRISPILFTFFSRRTMWSESLSVSRTEVQLKFYDSQSRIKRVPLTFIFYLFTFYLLSGSNGYAQSLSPTVLASSGDYAEAGNMKISWTLGELAVETLDAGSIILTQGFQQPLEIAGPDAMDENQMVWEIKSYHNPVNDKLTLAVKFEMEVDLTYEIFDLTGKKVWISQQRNMPAKYDFTIDMTLFQKGMYLLKVYSDDQRVHTIIKILKQ